MSRVRKKVVIVGDSACGKTTLIARFYDREFLDVFIPTVYDTKIVDHYVDGKTVQLALFDTAGQECFERIRRLTYKDADVFLICFSVDALDSLENVHAKWMPEIESSCSNVPCFVIGCRNDLREDVRALSWLQNRGLKMATPEMGEAVARRIGAEMYLECSSKTCIGVTKVLDYAARSVPLSGPKAAGHLLFIGDNDSGKTTLLKRYYTGEFIDTYIPRVFDGGTVHTKVDEMSIMIALLDTATGQPDLDQIRTNIYPIIHAVVICFSIDQPDSLRNVRDRWVPEVLHFCRDIPYVLVGCKSDTRDNTSAPNQSDKRNQGTIPPEDGLVVARQVGAETYLECSSKTNDGVNAVFEHVAKLAFAVSEKQNKRSECRPF